MKKLYRKRIPEPGCSSKETLDIQSSKHQRNGSRKIINAIRITSRPPQELRWGTNSVNSDKPLPKGYLKNRPTLDKL